MAKKRKGYARRYRPLIKNRAVASVLEPVFRFMPLIIVVAIIGLIFKLIATALVFDSGYFRIKTIRVVGEKSESMLGPIVKDLNSKKGINIFTIDLKECESNISYRHSELKDLRVSRALPDVLEVSYKIRKPFCQIDSGYFYAVSDDAVILPNPALIADPMLPVITGMSIPGRYSVGENSPYSKALKRAVLLLGEIKDSDFSNKYKVVKIDMHEPRSPSIFLEDGTKIEIGEYSFRQKERLLKEVLADLESKNKKAKTIDLRFEDVAVEPQQ